MCRLFGLSAAPARTHATFWLLDAPDSLTQQSHGNPDGTGLGTFSVEGIPRLERQPLPAFADERFAREAQHRESTTFLAHIRHASTGALEVRNTHPFEQSGRLFAHNGVIGGLAALEAELGEYRVMVAGDTDSERFFALITKRIDAHAGDITAGIASAARWVAERLPLYSINLILTTPTELWALRYPDTNTLYVLPRAPGGPRGGHRLEHIGSVGHIRAHCDDLSGHPAVVVASERMDDDPGWQVVRPGELVHVDGRLEVSRRIIIDHAPRHPLNLDDLGVQAAASQAGQ
jgi:predicted glutamine amidotransferase